MNFKKIENIVPVLSKSIEFNKLKEGEFILSNQKHKHYLKINQKTYDLLCLIDGERNIFQIQKLFHDKHKIEIELHQIENLLYKKLCKYGVLVGDEADIKPYKKPNYLKISFIIFNEKLVGKVVKNFRFLFHRKFAFVVIFVCLLILSLLAIKNFDAYKTFNLQESIIYFFIIMALSVTFHEFGHASSAYYFGAKHGGIGGGFYLFSPVYFADVTDIWRLNKWQRIVVNLSGMYFELIFCTLTGLIGFLIENYTITILSITVCVFTLFNLNPFMRSDGYWIVSDLINKPNLFRHSLDKLKDVYRTINGERVRWSKEDIVLFIYGLTSYILICLFLYYVLFTMPNSILKFPVNVIGFIKSLFDKNQEISLIKYTELVIPFIFYYLSFNLIINGLKKLKNNTVFSS